MIRKQDLSAFFEKEQIALYGILPLSACTIIHKGLLARSLPGAQSVIMFIIPYYAGEAPGRNISLYARAKDYHLYLTELHERLTAFLKERYPTAHFAGFGDHSPIAERQSAARAGLGMLGENGMLITKKYGSYVFIGEMLTDLVTDEQPQEPLHCPACGACKQACPGAFTVCASGIGQKKGALTSEEEALVRATDLIWGCDRCQSVCPFNRAVQITPIAFFKEDLLSHLTTQLLSEMSEEEWHARAFAWRGRQPLLRNLQLFEEV